jgi:hypothetical protein
VVLAEAHLAVHLTMSTTDRTLFFGLSAAKVCMLRLEMHAFPGALLRLEMHEFPDKCVN